MRLGRKNIKKECAVKQRRRNAPGKAYTSKLKQEMAVFAIREEKAQYKGT